MIWRRWPSGRYCPMYPLNSHVGSFYPPFLSADSIMNHPAWAGQYPAGPSMHQQFCPSYMEQFYPPDGNLGMNEGGGMSFPSSWPSVGAQNQPFPWWASASEPSPAVCVPPMPHWPCMAPNWMSKTSWPPYQSVAADTPGPLQGQCGQDAGEAGSVAVPPEASIAPPIPGFPAPPTADDVPIEAVMVEPGEAQPSEIENTVMESELEAGDADTGPDVSLAALLGTVEGCVVIKTENRPVRPVTNSLVLLFNRQTGEPFHAYTDNCGYYSRRVPEGHYIIQIRQRVCTPFVRQCLARVQALHKTAADINIVWDGGPRKGACRRRIG